MYQLRAELRAHSADVRGVAVSSEGVIATASRDQTVILWNVESVEPSLVLKGHSHFVNDLAFVDASVLVTASADKTLRVWNTKTGECEAVLSGHTEAVCSVALLPGSGNGRIISGSWDKTARVWDVESGMCLRTLTGHEASVWSAMGLPDGRLVTVGADKTVRLWPVDGSSDESMVLPSTHKDVVRDIVMGPKGGFLTVSNDSSMIYWHESGDAFSESQKLSDLHDGSYSYSVDSTSVSPGRWLLATSGEDNSVRLTEADFLSQTSFKRSQIIMHPGTVWSVSFSPTGDLISACSDGIARVFTKDPSLVAEEEVLKTFEKAVSERQLNTKVIGGVDVSKIPEADAALAVPGKKDGENKIVKSASGKPEVYMWSAAEMKWTKIGDVVDNPAGSSSTGEVMGKKYDFVFDVEVGEGGKKEKLGFNRGENPYLAAQRFIDDNELSQEFLGQIAQFIEQQVPADALQAAGQLPSDPLTGGSRYVPGGQSQSGLSDSDPLTGGGRYIPGGSTVPDGKLPPPRKLIPHRDGPISYRNTDQIDKIHQKLIQFNTDIAARTMELALSPEEMDMVSSSLMPKLKVRGGLSVILEDQDCAVVSKMLKWPSTNIFPVLDLARLAISLPSGSAYFFGSHGGAALKDVLRHMSSQEAGAPVYIMGCRFLCNMFGNRVSGAVVRREHETILKTTSAVAKSENRRARETHASLLINYGVLFNDCNASVQERETALRTIVDVISDGEQDEEVLYRLMIAMGTLICNDLDSAKKGVELGVAKAAADAAPISARLQQIAVEIATIIAV